MIFYKLNDYRRIHNQIVYYPALVNPSDVFFLAIFLDIYLLIPYI